MPQTISLPSSFPSTLQELWACAERIGVDLCDWAVVDPARRTFLNSAYRKSFRQRYYHQFSIPKKSGGERSITAPTGYLKGLQKAIAVLLGMLYTAPECVTGFTAERNVNTNARAHVGRNYVFNTDLKDFFPSITRAMVFDALRRHDVSEEVAQYIATVCTVTTDGDDLPEDVLPQGSPASPIISNMVCLRMDRNFEWLAGKYGLTYTRYADDMTFSSMHSVYGTDSLFLKEFRKVVASYGFRVNEEKTRLQKKGDRQEVTGIIVSDKTNVSRKYLKTLRAELFRMEMHGFTKDRYRSVRGKIAFVGMVRGQGDPLYCRLRTRVMSIKGRPQGFLAEKR